MQSSHDFLKEFLRFELQDMKLKEGDIDCSRRYNSHWGSCILLGFSMFTQKIWSTKLSLIRAKTNSTGRNATLPSTSFHIVDYIMIKIYGKCPFCKELTSMSKDSFVKQRLVSSSSMTKTNYHLRCKRWIPDNFIAFL